VSWIGAQDADAPIGITGISLGGYVTSLVAGVEDVWVPKMSSDLLARDDAYRDPSFPTAVRRLLI